MAVTKKVKKQKRRVLIGFSVVMLILIPLLLLNSCYYKPFIGYAINKNGFKNFSKKERIAGNNFNPERDYKINRYDWDLEVFPEEESISGKMDVYFTLQSDQKTILFDLQKKMKVTSFECSVENSEIERKGDLLYLKFEENTPINKRIKLRIVYNGKPESFFGQGPVRWEKDKQGRPWISSVTEGIGPHFIMPCNTLLAAEADSSSISITVPSKLTAVSNGKLKHIKTNKHTKTYSHEINNPINTYGLSFNIGYFKKITKPYTDINGIKREISFHVLDYNEEIANEFYNQTPQILRTFENLYGEFPFWEDGCKFVESTFSAMEHQSAIAMGSDYKTNWDDYNLTLVHELAHEWWGNSLTGKDYCDIWIHEGMATYSEALFLEKTLSKKDYDLKIEQATKHVSNTIPVLKECNVLYNSWVNNRDQDIYNKGALIMHSLRQIVNNDSLFFNSLLTIQKDLSKQHVSTKELVIKLNKLLGKDYTSFFDWYLKKIKPPILEVFIDEKNKKLYYKWENTIPFYNSGKILIKTSNKTLTLIPSTAYQVIEIPDSNLPEFIISKSIYYLVDQKNKLNIK